MSRKQHVNIKSIKTVDIDAWCKLLKQGHISTLARSITLVESKLPSDQKTATDILGKINNTPSKAVRIGITGAPGVGKSTFIEAFGLELLAKNEKVKIAILTFDPVSPLKGGSILGDKTRMQHLAVHPRAYIRPSPATLSSSIHQSTRSIIQLCEYAGYDYIIVETVGVGQSELDINHLVDYTLLLVSPNGGDELQGIKRGIMEVADMVIINKADGEMEAMAKSSLGQYINALKLISRDKVDVVKCSSIQHTGIDTILEKLFSKVTHDKKSKAFLQKRRYQVQLQTLKVIYSKVKTETIKIIHSAEGKRYLKEMKKYSAEKQAELFIKKFIRMKN